MTTVHRLYVREPLAAGAALRLAADRAHYVVRVLRARTGDELVLFDGRGGEHPARIEAIRRNGVALSVGPKRDGAPESALSIRLLQGISRGDRMDWVVQKVTELGVARITPVLASRSVVRLGGERAERRVEHWLGIARSACEQCGRNVVPTIDPPLPLGSALSAHAPGAVSRIVLDPGASASFGALAAGTAMSLLVGPEGGLSEAELDQARSAGYTGMRLGPRTLRTETAAVAAVTVLQARFGDLG